jgi:predicted nucleic acid-binding protein
LDASVILKWFRQGEVNADRALVIRRAYLEGRFTLLSPALCVYEIANVLRYKGDLPTKYIQEAIQSLYDLNIEWISPSKPLMHRAVELARAYDATVYDAVYAALAETIDIVFITADEKLADRMKSIPHMRSLGALDLESLLS